jgi:hypothetical protein
MENMSGFNNEAECPLSTCYHVLKLCQINFISTHKNVLYAKYMTSYPRHLQKKICKYYYVGILEGTLSVLS